jgi:cystathionine beta-lyase/cystathionine gamma-synthase
MSQPSQPRPHAPPLHLSSVWECESPAQADRLLAGQEQGYVYRRDGHPNADSLAELCCRLHEVERGIATASGMAAIAAAVLATVRSGEHVLYSNRLYGKTAHFIAGELARLGVESSAVDMSNLTAMQQAIHGNTRLVIAETIANPRLEVVDIAALAEIAHRGNARLLIDNTFATPYVCRPAAFGADLVMESLTKMMNGHSDVVLGFLGGEQTAWDRIPGVVSTWGFGSSPLDCWLAQRGLGTLSLRMERACANALRVAERLAAEKQVERVDYPGLSSHPQHALAAKQFGNRFGSLATFHLRGGIEAANRFIASARRIPFCPSLGELATTLSHPESTSHRGLAPQVRQSLGITGGTIRLSVGIEPLEEIDSALDEALAGLTNH